MIFSVSMSWFYSAKVYSPCPTQYNNDMQTASLRQWWLSSPECSLRGVSKPQSATGEGLSVLLPSANRLREVLAKALPERIKLQRALNRILRAQTPRFVKKGKRSDYIAIDLTLVPYHGECYEDEKEIVRSQAKSGTTHFHGYATVSIVHDNQRYVLGLRFVEKGESMEKNCRLALGSANIYRNLHSLRLCG